MRDSFAPEPEVFFRNGYAARKFFGKKGNNRTESRFENFNTDSIRGAIVSLADIKMNVLITIRCAAVLNGFLDFGVPNKWIYAQNLLSNICVVVPKALRFELFLARLASAPTASSHDEAFALIANTLTQVEDLLSGVIANPSQWEADGRLYPPQPDSARASDDFKGVTVYRNKGHRTLVALDGAIQIVEVRTSTILLEKPGTGVPFYRPTPHL